MPTSSGLLRPLLIASHELAPRKDEREASAFPPEQHVGALKNPAHVFSTTSLVNLVTNFFIYGVTTKSTNAATSFMPSVVVMSPKT